MARVIYAPAALADSAEIMIDLAEKSGRQTVLKFDLQFEQLFDRLAKYPESAVARPALGVGVRIGIVTPYVIIYRYTEDDDTVTVLRLIDGRRNISKDLLTGGR